MLIGELAVIHSQPRFYMFARSLDDVQYDAREVRHMRNLHSVWMPFLLLANTVLVAQQVKFIDLTATPQRVQLRYPPAPTIENGISGAGVSGSISDCGQDIRDPRSLRIYLQSAIANGSDPMEPFEVENPPC
jgi:hypothetical protein